MLTQFIGLLGATALMASLSHNSTAHAQSDDPGPAAALIQPWASDDQPGVAVALSMDGEVIFAQGAGLANLEHGQPITPETPFLVASVSKQITAFATFLLVVDGALDPDADIRTFLPELSALPHRITVRHLLDHSGGLRETANLTAMAGWLDDDIRAHAPLLQLIFRQQGVNFEAGTEIDYSNTGYILLAEIVSRVSGVSFQDFTRDRIFTPLGMENTRFPDTRNTPVPGRASAYYPSGTGFNNVIGANETVGSTGLFTTAVDLLIWADNFRTRTVGDNRVFEMMAERFTAANGEESTFARGQEMRIYNGLETWSHGGRDAGYRAFILRVPDEAFALSILSNRTDFDTAALAFALVDSYLGDRPAHAREDAPEWAPSSLSELRALEGDYQVHPGVIFSFIATEDGLGFRLAGNGGDPLQILPQTGERQFRLNPAQDHSLRFAAPENGQSPRVDYVIGLHGSLSAHRINLSFSVPENLEASDYVGVYDSPELATFYTLSASGGQLVADHARTGAFTLTPYHDDRFSAIDGALQNVEFVRDADGHVSGFVASTQNARGLVFHRRN